MKKLCVIGNPIEHSLSPKLHNHWIKKHKLDFIYEKYLLEKGDLENFINDIKSNKVFGCNVTVPYKQDIIQYCDELTNTAKNTNSVNTIFFKDNKIMGDNTDVLGFQKSLNEVNYDFKGKSALILGAGGVVPSIIQALKNLEVLNIHISNRTKENALKIKSQYPDIHVHDWGNIEDVDIYINATSIELQQGQEINLDFSNQKNKLFYDVIYYPEKTKFLKQAEINNNRIINGKMMFLYQAQAAFKIWTNINPSVTQEEIALIHD